MHLQAERLHGLSPTARLTGGFVFAQNKEGHPVASVDQLELHRTFQLIFSDGEAEVSPVSVTKRRDDSFRTEDGQGGADISTEQKEE